MRRVGAAVDATGVGLRTYGHKCQARRGCTVRQQAHWLDGRKRETKMSAALARDLVNKLVSTLRSLRQPAEFVCSDCERWDRCGMPSSDNCIFRPEQITRGDWQMKTTFKSVQPSNGVADAIGSVKNAINRGPRVLVMPIILSAACR